MTVASRSRNPSTQILGDDDEGAPHADAAQRPWMDELADRGGAQGDALGHLKNGM